MKQILSFFLAIFLPLALQAQEGECKSDVDCPAYFTCQSYTMPCGAWPTEPCHCACEAGDECPPCDCQRDEAPDYQDCEEISRNYCVFTPKECDDNSQCQKGFLCKEEQICSGGGCACAGSAGCICPDCQDEFCPPCECDVEEKPDCHCEELTCEPGDTSYCQPAMDECLKDSECPEGWECAIYSSGDCPSDAVISKDGDIITYDEPDCEPSQEAGICLPPGWADYITGVAQDGSLYFDESMIREDMDDGPLAGGVQEKGASENTAAAKKDKGSSTCSFAKDSKPSFMPLFLILAGILALGILRRHFLLAR